MISQLPILQILIPLIAAPLCILSRERTLPMLIAAVAVVLTLMVSIALAIQVTSVGTISYAIGNWEAPWGIEYRIDHLTIVVLLVVSGAGAAVLLAGIDSIVGEIEESRAPLFYSLYLLNLAGLLGMAVTGDVFNLFVFLEISSLATYSLVALGSDRRALTASFQYLIIGTVGATFYVIGIGLLYMMTGTLNMSDLAARVPEVADTLTIKTALAFILIGLGVKLGMMPVHFWLPNAYARAPSVVSAFLAATATKVALYAMLRVIFEIFGAPIFLGSHLAEVVIALGLLAMVVASATAVSQRDVKRLLAYSSLAQIGYILFALGLSSEPGLTAAILHMFNHGLMKAALFMALTAVALRAGGVGLTQFDGLGREMPLTMLAFTLGGLSLVGLPLTVGFISKWYLMVAAFDEGQIWIVAVILFSSLLALLYVWKVVEHAYFRARPEGAAKTGEAPLPMLIGIWALVGANILFGVESGLITDLARRAALVILGGA